MVTASGWPTTSPSVFGLYRTLLDLILQRDHDGHARRLALALSQLGLRARRIGLRGSQRRARLVQLRLMRLAFELQAEER